MTQPWRCGCGNQCKATAEFCPKCGTHWSRASYAQSATQPPYSNQKGDWWRPKSPRHRNEGGKGKHKAKPHSPRRRGKGQGGKDEAAPAAASTAPPQAEAMRPTTLLAQMPAPPSAPKTNMPTTAMAESSEKLPQSVLDIMSALSSSKDSLPPEVRTMLEVHLETDHQHATKQLHKLVAQQSRAHKELSALRKSRAIFVQEWTAYLGQLTQLLDKQMKQKAAAMEEMAKSEASWQDQLAAATRAIRQQTSAAQVVQDSSDEEVDAMEAEVDADAQMEASRQAAVDNSLRQEAVLLTALQSAAQASEVQAQQYRERTLRRQRRKESDIKDEPKDATGRPVKCLPDFTGPISAQSAAFTSVLEEPTYVSRWMAPLLALCLQFEVSATTIPGIQHGLFEFADPRAEEWALSAGEMWNWDEVEALPLDKERDGSVFRRGVTLAGCSSVRRPMFLDITGPSKADKDLPLACMGPGQFSDVRLRIVANIDLYPADMDRPEVRQQQLTSFDWLTGWRIRGGVGYEAQQDRYALYSTDHHLQLRTMRRGWSINELIADVAGVVPRVRSVHLLVDRLDGLPAVQIAVTTREAAANQFAIPLDFRGMRGRVCTINLEPGLPVDTVVRRISEECPATHVPQRDYRLVLPDNAPLRALEGHNAWPDFLRGTELPPPGPLIQEVEAEGDPVNLLQHSPLLPQPPQQPPNVVSKGHGPVFHPQGCRSFQKRADIPEPPRPSVHYSILPADVVLAQPAQAPRVALEDDVMARVAPPRFYTIFEPRVDLRRRPADATWQLADYVEDAVRQLPVPVRMVFAISVPLPSFATPQLVLTLASAQPRARSLPVDLRNVGGLVHTIEVSLQCNPADIWTSLRDKGIDLSRQWEAAHAAGHVRFNDQFGHEVMEWSADDDKLEWVMLIATAAEWQESIITYGSTEAAELLARISSSAASSSQSTTLTVTAKLPMGDCLGRPLPPACADAALPTGTCLPADLCQGDLLHRPLSDSCLFPSLGPPSAQGTPVAAHQFTIIANGHPVVTLPATTAWTLANFFQAAFAWLGHAPRFARILTQSLPGLPEPQIVLTDQDVPPSAVVVPLDLRPWGVNIVPVVLTPGLPVSEVLSQLQLPMFELAGNPIYHDLFLQDTRGGVHQHTPDSLDEVQWFRVCCASSSWGAVSAWPLSSTTTTTGMQAGDRRVRFVLSGGGTSLQLPPVTVAAADPVVAVAELLFAMASAGRLVEGSAVTLGAAWPLSVRGDRVVPFVVSAGGDHVQQVVLFDPSYDGSQLYAMGVQPGLYAEDLMSNNYRQCGLTLWVNGVHMSAVVRPLRTGDYVQLLPDRPLQASTASHPEELLSSINRLRAFSAPLRVPAFSFESARASHETIRTRARDALIQAMDRATRTRVEMMGLPARVSQAVTLLEPGRAPHHLHLPLRLTPTLAEAEESVRDTGVVPDNYRLVDTLLDARASSVFIALPPNVPGIVYTICDPAMFGAFHLLHLLRGVRPPTHRLPVRTGYVLALPARIEDGAHIATARPINYAPVNRRPATIRAAPSRSGSAPVSMDTATSGQTAAAPMSEQPPASDADTLERPAPRPATHAEPSAGTHSAGDASAPSTGGTSLVQLSLPVHRRKQLIFDDSPESARAQAIAQGDQRQGATAVGEPSKFVVPTPAGRRRIPVTDDAVPCADPRSESGPTAPQTNDWPLAVGLPSSPGPSHTLCLEQALPPPCSGLGFGLVPDMLDFFLHEHLSQQLTSELPALPDLLPSAAQGWLSLPAWDKATPLQALHVFTDGSFFPGSSMAGWSVVVLGPCNGTMVRVGFFCGTCPGSSAYNGELCALVHAHALALALRPIPVAVASDCISALQVAFGTATFSHDDMAARALAGLSIASAAFRQAVMPLHVRSHTGCPFNDTADALAKGAAKGAVPQHSMLEAKAFWAGVRERVSDWLWLLAPQFSGSSMLPTLSAHGAWTKAACEVPPSTHLHNDVLLPAPRTVHADAEVLIRLLQYNCLSLRGAPAQELMVRGLRRSSVHAAFFQETRLGATGVGANEDYWVISSPCTSAGVGGCQIWLHKTAKLVVGLEQGWTWNRASFTILYSGPQLLVATATAGPLHFGLVAGHAPCATAPEAARREWWHLLTAQVRRLPRGFTLLAGLDANARFCSEAQSADSIVSQPPVCDNAVALSEFAGEFGLSSQAAVSNTGQAIRTWTSPQGRDGIIDYLLCPSGWCSAFATHDTPDLQDQHQGFDHWPLLAEIRASTQGHFMPKTQTFCRRALGTEAGRAAAAAAVATLPKVSWDTDVSTHVQLFHQHLHECLTKGLPRTATPARHPAVTAATLELVRRHRQHRQVLRATTRTARKAKLHALFEAWRHGTANSGTCRRCVAATQRMFEVCVATMAAGKSVRQAMQRDKADFSRRQIATARGAGPSKFAHLLRAITRQGRKFKPPKLLPVIRQGTCEHVGLEAVTKALGQSFASAERATAVAPADFAAACQSVCPLTVKLDAASAPSPVDLARGFLGLSSGRAPGRSGLPAEVFASNPHVAALAYAPVVLKILARGVGPVQWSGGVAHSIPKGSKDPCTVQGWRAILLLETDAKAFQKAWRPYIMDALDPVRAVGQHGGIPKHTLEQPAALVRAHLQYLHASGSSGGALFVDCAAAYYSIVRDFYFSGPHHTWSDEELVLRSQLFFEHKEDQEAFVAEMKNGQWLTALMLPPELHRIIAAQLQDTWYIDGNPGTTLYSTNSGTSPGSPVADALFAFLFSRFLRGIEAFLQARGVSPHVAVCRSKGVTAEAPAWADDVVILFASAKPADVPTTLAAIGEQVITRLRRLGLTANLGPGKTEAVVSIRGRDSRRVRRALLAADAPSVSLADAHGPLPSLRVVPNYVHLGTLLNAELSEVPNLQRRAHLLYAAFKPIRNKLLSNPYLHFHEKRELILSRVIPCFMHGSGLWRLATQQEQEAATGPMNSVLRRCVRPLTGKSAAHLTQAEVAAALDVPVVEELLRVHQIRALAQVLRDDMQPSWPGFQADGVWLRQACSAACKIMPSPALDAILCDGLPSDLPRLARHFADQGEFVRHACRRYLRKCRASCPPVDWAAVLQRQEQEV
ncbi:hypothetical protein AK812_SmicGene4821 [Symbiodinium microadriaticum]|uniref:RNase H type-1 domain-containing protein n=1 Tax=Symbiodinium microadriaticum TaxID=2951 RepID=A0A1Q9EVA1_SYMMI|nr:hypothetical protein AK812_SmicGene4821 [Symbiodinium microadriaticum]